MSRFLTDGYFLSARGNQQAINLLTIPDADSRPNQWSDELLASARGEINYQLTHPHQSEGLTVKLEKLRHEIEAEMRKRLAVKDSPKEFAARCLFHESEIDYRTGDREARDTHVRRR